MILYIKLLFFVGYPVIWEFLEMKRAHSAAKAIIHNDVQSHTLMLINT